MAEKPRTSKVDLANQVVRRPAQHFKILRLVEPQLLGCPKKPGDVIEHQMDRGDLVSEVVIDEKPTTSMVSQIEPTVMSIRASKLSSLDREYDDMETFEHLANRHHLIATIPWKTTDPAGSVRTHKFPDSTKFKDLVNSPLGAVFRNYRYLSFDTVLTFKLNSSKLHVGTLLVCWNYYSPEKLLANLGVPLDLCRASQRPHILLSAGANSTGQLIIPYKRCFPMINISEMESIFSYSLLVLNQLLVPTESSITANLSVFLSLKNIKRIGLCPKIEHQMFGMEYLVAGVEGMLKQYRKDNNRDKPTVISPAVAVVPYGSHSWCHGVGVEVSNVLRLDPRYTTPHFDVTDEMIVGSLKRKFSFFRTIQWSATHSAKTNLFRWRVKPTQVEKVLKVFPKALDAYSVTSLAAISSLFSYWRGEIEYRIDFVVPFINSGQVAISFIPGFQLNETNVSFEDAISGYVTYFDLQEANSILFKVPYQCYRPWLEVHAEWSGVISMWVVNPITTTAGTSQNFDVNIFVRGGESFELAVPSHCSYGVFNNNALIPSVQRYYLQNPYYSGLHGEFEVDKIKYLALRKDDSNLTYISNFDGLYDRVYKVRLDDQGAGGIPYIHKASDGTKSVRLAIYLVPVRMSDSQAVASAPVLLFRSESKAANFAKYNTPSQWKISMIKYALVYVEEGAAQNYNTDLDLLSVPQVRHQSDQREGVDIETVSIPMSVKTSSFFFGEGFSDLKDLCRRYQFYGDISVDLDSDQSFGKTFLRVPVLPCGLYPDFDAKSGKEKLSLNFLRSNIISLIGSGFIFFRGGLRFHIVITSSKSQNTSKNLTLAVSHNPSIDTSRKFSIPKTTSTYDFNPNGIATFVQSLGVNNIIEIEVPYYRLTDYILTRCYGDPNEVNENTLGSLDFCLLGDLTSPVTLGIQMYYSFADDARFTSFQGFGPIFKYAEIPETVVPPKLRKKKISHSKEVRQSVESSDFETVEHQMGLAEKVGKGMAEGAAPIMREVGEDLMGQASQIFDKVKDVFKIVVGGCGKMSIQIIIHIVQFLKNPCFTTGALSFAGIAITIGLFDEKMFSPLVEAYQQYLRPLFDLVSGRVCHQMDDEWMFGPCSSLLALVAGAVGYKMKKGEKTPDFFGHVMKNTREYAMTSNSLHLLIRHNFEALIKAYRWFTVKLAGLDYENAITSKVGSKELKEFLIDSYKYIRDPTIYAQVVQNPVMQHEIYLLHLRGQMFITLQCESPGETPLFFTLRETINKLSDLVERMCNDCLTPNVGYEPYFLQLFGKPGVGKSFIVSSIITPLLDSINYKTMGEKIFYRTCGVEYWNGINVQPLIGYDDLFSTKEGAHVAYDEIIQLKSPCPFNPKTAHLEDKKRRINPLGIIACSNFAFHDDGITGTMLEPAAFHRRRNMLWEVRVAGEDQPEKSMSSNGKILMKEAQDRFKMTGKPSFQHLQFRLAKDPCTSATSWTPWQTYETFLIELTNDFKMYRALELKRFYKRYNDMVGHVRETPLATKSYIVTMANKIINERKDFESMSTMDFRNAIGKKADAGYGMVFGLSSEEEIEHQMVDENSDDEDGNLDSDDEGSSDSKDEERIAELHKKQQELYQKLYGVEAENPITKTEVKQSFKFKKRRACSLTSIESSVADDTHILNYPADLDPFSEDKHSEKIDLEKHLEEITIEMQMELHRERVVEVAESLKLLKVRNPLTMIRLSKILKQIAEVSSRLRSSRALGKADIHEIVHAVVYKCSHYKLLASQPGNVVFNSKLGMMEIKHQFSQCSISPSCCSYGSNCLLDTKYGHLWITCWLRMNFLSEIVTNSPIRQNHMPRNWLRFFERPELVIVEAEVVNSIEQAVSAEVEAARISMRRRLRQTGLWGKLKRMMSWKNAFRLLCFGMATWGIVLGVKKLRGPAIQHEAIYTDEDTPKITKGNKTQVKMSRWTKGWDSIEHHSSQENVVFSLLEKNSAILKIKVEEEFRGTIKIFGITDRLIIGVKHFFEQAQAYHKKHGDKVKIIYCKGTFSKELLLKEIDIYLDNSSSICFAKLAKIPQFVDLRKHIASEKDHVYIPTQCSFVEPQLGANRIKSVSVKKRKEIKIPKSGDMKEVCLSDIYVYAYGGQGLCGSILVGDTGIPKIYAVHVAGKGQSEGYAQMLTRELIEEFEGVSHQMFYSGEVLECVDEPASFPFPTQVEYLGQDEKVINYPIKTQLVKSLMHDQVFKSVKVPAPLSSKDYDLKEKGLDPMVLAIEKYSGIPTNFDDEILEECKEDLCLDFAIMQPIFANKGQVLTEHETFTGIPGVDGYNPINLHTSEGYPLCLKTEEQQYHFKGKEMYTGKHWLFDFEIVSSDKGPVRRMKKMHPLLEDLHKQNMEKRELGIVPKSIFVCTLKDQLVFPEKALAGKNRVFASSPVELTWATKKFFGHFQAAYQNSRIDNGTAIGINPLSREWTKLAMNLLQADPTGQRIITGDYKAFGDTTDHGVLEKVFDCIEYWYFKNYGTRKGYGYCKKIRRVLFYEIIHCIYYVKKNFFRRHCGIPSGFALTVEFNDLVNKMYIRYIWLESTKRSLRQLRAECYFCCYGDDLIMSVGENIDNFNFEVLKKGLSSHNIEFTSAEKTDKVVTFENFSEATFLKAHFRPSDVKGLFFYRLPKSSCTELVNWNRKGNDPVTCALEASRACLQNIHSWGKEEFEETKEKLLDWFAANPSVSLSNVHLPTFNEIMRSRYGL